MNKNMDRAIEVLTKELKSKEYVYTSYKRAGISTIEVEKSIYSLKYAIGILEGVDI
jgi:ribosomal protein S2